MLAQPGRSADEVMSRANAYGGAVAEIKYDGERVQVHKQGNRFAYFSRSLKPIPLNKVCFTSLKLKLQNETVVQLVVSLHSG